jgi:hypothetical protein
MFYTDQCNSLVYLKRLLNSLIMNDTLSKVDGVVVNQMNLLKSVILIFMCNVSD